MTTAASEADTLFSLEDLELAEKESASTGGRFLNPSKIQGEVRIRTIGKGIQGWGTWVEKEGFENGVPMRFEKKPAEPPANRRINKDGQPAPMKFFMAMPVWNYEAGEIQILELTQKSLQKSLLGYIADKEDWGNPNEFDIKISRKGESLQTEYTLKAVSKKPVAKEIVEAYEEAGVNIRALYDGEDPFAKAS